VTQIYMLIVALCLYGDVVLKGYLNGDIALLVQYLTAVLIILMLSMNGSRTGNKRPGQTVLRTKFWILYLIVCYVALALVALLLDGSVRNAFTHVAYIGIPLAFVIATMWRYPQFDINRFGNIFLVLMIPVNIVGVVQYTVDPTFMIGKNYSELGGIVLRGFSGGHFVRFPSLFVSADRYSAIGLMQVYYSFLLIYTANEKKAFYSKYAIWLSFNFSCGIAAILISGARSRLVLVAAVGLLMALSMFFRGMRMLRKSGGLPASTNALILVLLFSGGANFAYGGGIKVLMDFPVVVLLLDSIEERRFERRVGEYLNRVAIAKNISLFGEGLGTLGKNGKPAEIGVESIWIECGFFGGVLLILGYVGLILTQLKPAVIAFIRGSPLLLGVFSLPVLVVFAGLLTGLTSAFELSSATLMMIAVGAITIKLQAPTDKERRRGALS
jgi:hypothetical protein